MLARKPVRVGVNLFQELLDRLSSGRLASRLAILGFLDPGGNEGIHTVLTITLTKPHLPQGPGFRLLATTEAIFGALKPQIGEFLLRTHGERD